MSSKKIKVGIIGSGRMSAFHLEALSTFNDISIKAIASTKKGKNRRDILCKKYSVSASYSNYIEMLDREKLDCVYVIVSVDKIFEVSKSVMNRNLNIFIEKPPGLFKEETLELLKIANSKSLVNFVGFQRRFYSHISYARKYIKQNGGLVSIVVEAPERFDQIKLKKKYNKLVLDKWFIANGIHCLDLLLFFGGDFNHVNIISKSILEKKNKDSMHALIDFKNNAVGHYISNWMSPGSWCIKLYCINYRIDIDPLETGKIFFSDGKEEELPIDNIDKKFKPGIYKINRLFINSLKSANKQKTIVPDLNNAYKLMLFAEKFL